MSRLPTISTPGRMSTSSPSGLPTPTATGRRPRSSLTSSTFTAPSSQMCNDDPDAAAQLQEALRNRPPSSVRVRSGLGAGLPADDPDTPTGSALGGVSGVRPGTGKSQGSGSMGLRNLGLGVPAAASAAAAAGGGGGGGAAGPSAPRTPSSSSAVSSRPRPSLGIGHPTTPSASGSRSVSRASNSMARPSLGASGLGTSTGPFITPRRPSMAAGGTHTPNPPTHRRTESRQSSVHTNANGQEAPGAYWVPVVGEKVRIGSMGFEGTLRFMGEVGFRAGVWAGVELEGGFAGKGKNDGSVDGVQYFQCPPDCGVFVMASRLSAPTADASRPASVASQRPQSQASHVSQQSGSGRMTPASASASSRPATTTPHRAARAVSSSVRGPAGRLGLMKDDSPDSDSALSARPTKTLLGISTSSNAAVAQSKITAGSRASKYIGMTAKQLEQNRAGLSASRLGMSTTTPKPSRVSLGGVTPARGPRQSLGNSLVTPRPRGPRASAANEMMPPPPSPSNINKIVHAQAERLEEEVRELRRRNADLEVKLSVLSASAGERDQAGIDDAAALHEQMQALQQEADELRHQLSASHADAADATKLAEELEVQFATTRQEAETHQRELSELRKEVKLVEERAQGELQAGIEANERQVMEVLERAEMAEAEGAEMRALVEELTQAGQATISLYETKQYDFEDRIRALEEKNRSLEDRLGKARESAEQATLNGASRDPTIAEIDNETLQAQLKHLQTKIGHLEEELEEVRVQADKDEELYKGKVTKARDGERAAQETIKDLKAQAKRMDEQAGGAKSRVGELEGALKENQAALEGARAEIEGLRAEAGEVPGLKGALVKAEETERAYEKKKEEVRVLQVRVEELLPHETKAQGLDARVKELEVELDALKEAALSPKKDSLPPARSPRLSTGPEETEKKLRGFQHIIDDLSAENAELKDKLRSNAEEMSLLKEEVKLLEETNELSSASAGSDVDGPGTGAGFSCSSGPQAERADPKKVKQLEETVRELNREVSELESLVESKIYREDELEREVEKWKRRVAASELQLGRAESIRSVSAHSARSSISTSASQASDAESTYLSAPSRNGTSPGRAGSTRGKGMTTREAASKEAEEERCELCEGPHELDKCPVFAGDVSAGAISPSAGKGQKGSAGAGAGVGEGKGGKGKYCQDCESTEHDTADCPLAEDVF